MSRSSQNTNATLGGGGVHHVAIRTRDFDTSKTFYTQQMGFVPKVGWGQAPSRAVWLDTGDGNFLEIFERPDQAAPGQDEHAILHIGIRTDNVDAALDIARAAGCEVTMEPRDLTLDNTVDGLPDQVPIRIAFFKGPDGEIIELFANTLT